jgi:Na+-transporting methylmalonyl-CoA/oxaloacetate decarboxylase gamma subunit
MKFGLKEYFKPTPKRIRIFGDSLAATGTFGAAIVILNGSPVLGTIIMVVAVIGKFISNFFTEEDANNTTNNS